MKVCNVCNSKKQESEFYKGHAKCKDCYVLKVKLHREEKADYYREYDANRANLPHRIEARLRYSQTPQGKDAHRMAKKKWSIDNVIKRAANIIVGNAVRDGRLIKSYECEDCGKNDTMIHGHHDNYDYPLDVRWLCPACHTKWHKINGSGINGMS
jgi:hypothetical protein